MLKTNERALLGARIPTQLKEKLLKYCLGHGIKMNYFVSEAIKQRLDEITEEKELSAVAKDRLLNAEFVPQKELEKYLSKRGIKYS
jgi:hypothetical protein